MKRGASQREVGSVLENLEFIVEIAAAAGGGKDLQKQVAALQEIKDRLAQMGGK
jgi:hypothetical protein